MARHLRETDPRDDKTRIEATKGGLLRDSYRWILDHDDFQQWRDNPQSQLLWIKGDPGKGKTMLLCGIIDELKKERGNRLSYFFCKATEAQLSNATAVLRGLIYLVLVQQPSLISHVREKHDHAGKQLFEDTNAWYALREIFIAILEDPALNSIIIIIDALDECVTGLPELLKFIIEQSPLTSRVKWIVSSRNQLAIEEKLDNVEQKIRLQLESNKDLITEAVDTYIEYKVDQLAREKKYDKETRDAVQRHLVGNADGTFLWVALVCQELADPKVRKRHTLDTLKSFPPGLDPLYERMMEHISDSKDAAYCKEILAIASVVCRPITLDELKALAESLEELDQDELKEIIKACGSFLTLREDVIYFVHQSARDYLSEQAASTVFPSGRAVAHCGVFRQSLVAMRKYLRRDIYNLAHPGISIDDIRTPLPDPLAPVRYSCVYWVDHLRDSKPVDSMATDAFIRDKFLHWLEALSVMKKLPDGASALQKLASLYREFSPVATTLHRDSLQRQSPTSASDALSFLMDAIRFLSTFGSIIAKYLLQIYGTALAFCPRSSKVRVKFWNEQHSLKDVRGIQQWGPLLHSFEAHTGMAVSMSFSPNSNTLASSSADKTVRLWNVTAGTSTHTLRGHNALVKAVTFSPNGNLVASASFDCTVRIWEVATGQCRSILEGHTQYVQSVAFSPDGCAIASASDDGTVRIWDTATGSCQRILDGYSDSIGKVTFSTKSNVVVSDLHAGKVRIWKDTMLFLEFEGNEFGETAFSSDAKLFAAVLNDNSVRVTCTATGKADIIPRSDGCVVCSVAFSPKSNLVAMGLSDHTVQIWQNGKLFRIYRNHRGHASSITFSFDGSSIASGSEDYSIQLWDVALCTSNQTPEDHSDMVWSVAFSPNGTVAASGSADKTIRLWNVTAGTSTHTLRGHNALVKAVTFSPNGNLVASASFDCTVRIWEVATGQCRSILEGHTHIGLKHWRHLHAQCWDSSQQIRARRQRDLATSDFL
ncbi:hypothetical protein CEP52_017244 [Fusarium oligoseptatum]|uniref:Mitochondrial division protein 1 n=1 Tax=Fusarium oligoseptatum TaxID=2604345 RepID=A0A428RUG9_9HYPO|nr:hypothetical protein CEP52_017244 [Fusarium oligoseptatum]